MESGGGFVGQQDYNEFDTGHIVQNPPACVKLRLLCQSLISCVV